MQLNDLVQNFTNYTDKLYAFGNALSVFHWDQSTGAPKAGSQYRAKSMSILAQEAFEMSISREMNEFITELSKHESELDELTLGIYKQCKRDYEKTSKIPPDEYGKYSELTVNANAVWEEAKEKSDFGMFAPFLKQVIDFNKKFIGYRGYKDHPYNTLLDDYEPNLTVAELDVYFSNLKSRLVPLLKKIMASKKEIRKDFLSYEVPKEKQQQVSALLLEVLGYDFNKGMLRESVHPFSSSLNQNDSRITTCYHTDKFLSSFYSVAHEFGHAIYEIGKKKEIAATLMDNGVSMAIHESQSRFYENVIGRSLEFIELIYGRLIDILGSRYADITPTMLYEASNISEPGLIRIEADELTYSLHIMARYEMEKMIFSEDVDINKLPGMWNDKYEEYLGVRPPNDALGILQDVHWSEGYFGYFPSYSLGSAYSAQLLYYMGREFNVFEQVKNGKINVITDWLADKIHQFGSLRTPDELITAIAGEKLNAEYYVKYLEDKYTKIYSL